MMPVKAEEGVLTYDAYQRGVGDSKPRQEWIACKQRNTCSSFVVASRYVIKFFISKSKHA